MSFTYDLSTDVGKLRLNIPDTVETSAKFSDEELESILAEYSNDIEWSTWRCCMVLYTLAAERAGSDVEVGQIDIRNAASFGDKWKKRADDIYKKKVSGLDPLTTFAATLYVGGIYQTDRDSNQELMEDDVIVKNNFWSNYNDADDESYLSGGNGESNG